MQRSCGVQSASLAQSALQKPFICWTLSPMKPRQTPPSHTAASSTVSPPHSAPVGR